MMPLQIIAGSGPTLSGRDWLGQIKLNWQQIHHIHTKSYQAVLSRYPAVFQEGLGTFKGYKVKINVLYLGSTKLGQYCMPSETKWTRSWNVCRMKGAS